MRPQIGQFLQYLRVERGASPHTLKGYREDLHALAEYLADGEGQSPAPGSITTNELRGFLSALHEAGYAKTSISRRLASVRSFIKFGQREGWAKSNPAKALRNPRKSRKLPHFLTTDEVGKLLDAPKGNTPAAIRDRAILETLYSAGLRVSELVGLNDGDLDFPAGIVRIRGKGKKERLVADRLLRCPRAQSAGSAVRKLSAREKNGPRSAGIHQQIRHAADHAQRRPDARKVPQRNRPRPAHVAPHAPPQLRHAPVRPRRRHPQRAGTTGPQKPGHDANLHARQHGQPPGGV